VEVIDPLGTVSPTVAPATAGGTAHQAQAHALTRKATVHTFLTSTAMRGWKTISTGTPTALTGVKLVMGGLELPSQPPNLDAATLVISLNQSVPVRQLQQFAPQTQGLSWAAGALAKHVEFAATWPTTVGLLHPTATLSAL